MLSFEQLGHHGRLGNQLFQYAFLRTLARRLGVPFYCPAWRGDELFTLNDDHERAPSRGTISHSYQEPLDNCGFNPGALQIGDQTEIKGCFQSTRYFNADDVQQWYTFRPGVTTAAAAKYAHIDFSQAIGIHLRFGDMKGDLSYPLPKVDYYRKALEHFDPAYPILVFTDEPDRVKDHLQSIWCDRFQILDGNRDDEDFFLMRQCRSFVCSISTFSWWAAYLADVDDRRIVAPVEWIRPGYYTSNPDLACDDWHHIRTCRPVVDDYRFLIRQQKFTAGLSAATRRSWKENARWLKDKWEQIRLSNRRPPRKIPNDLIQRFTMDRRITVLHDYQDHSQDTPQRIEITTGMIDEFIEQINHDEEELLMPAVAKYPIKHKQILISRYDDMSRLGFCLRHLAQPGIERTPFLDTEDTRVRCVDSSEDFKFDMAMISSRVESMGLGKFGEKIDPDADIKYLQSMKRYLKPDGLLWLSVLVGKDKLIWNNTRVYGQLLLPRLFDGWTVIEAFGMDEGRLDQANQSLDECLRPLFILQPKTQL